MIEEVERLLAGESLAADRVRRLFAALDADEHDELRDDLVYVAATVALIRKGPTLEELLGLVDDIAARSIDLTHRLAGFGPLVDISGTGGDAMDTPNVGSLASFVVAAAGLPVAKQATSSFTGISGSADLYALLGLDVSAAGIDQTVELLETVGVTAMHTPSHSPLFARRLRVLRRMREAGLHFVTPWHLVAWVHSPFPLTGRVYGVFDERYRRQLAEVFRRRFPAQRVLVVRGREGLDEVSVSGLTDITEVSGGERRDYRVSPSCLGLAAYPSWEASAHAPQDFQRLRSPGVCAAERAAIRLRTAAAFPDQAFEILAGRGRPAHEALVAANAGAALYAGGSASSLEAGTALALETLRSGAAKHTAEAFARVRGDHVAVERLARAAGQDGSGRCVEPVLESRV